MSAEEFSRRLRHLRNKNDWTVQEMSEMTGIPKRTLDKYMLKGDAPQPGLEAIVRIASGLGVSLDWLLLGEEAHAKSWGRIVRLSTRAIIAPFLENIVTAYDRTDDPEVRALLIGNGKIMGQTPDEVALDLAIAAGIRAEELSILQPTDDQLRIGEVATELKARQVQNNGEI